MSIVVRVGSAKRMFVVFTRAGVLAWVPATWVALVTLGLWGCGEREASAPPTPARAATSAGAAYREVEVTLGGSVHGRVVWVGERPPEVRAPSDCEDAAPRLEIGPRGGVAGTVVVLTGIREGRPLVPGAAELAFAGCRLSPQVVAVGVGTVLRLRNEDGSLHNAHAVDAAGNTRFDVAVLPSGGPGAAIRLDASGILAVRDDARAGGTLAWIHLIEHPYFAVTDGSGAFRLEDVPTGRYTLTVWHEGPASGGPGPSPAIVLTRAVTVVSGQETPADFQMDLRLVHAAGAPLGEPGPSGERR